MFDNIEDEINKLVDIQTKSPELKRILETSAQIQRAVNSEIVFSKPVLKQGENAVIYKNSINVIQGQAGTHKSRLAETICSAFLRQHHCKNDLLGFKRLNFDCNHTVVYVDTERNLTEQLPYALQSIQIKAGYPKEQNPSNFKYISLLEIERAKRYNALNDYLAYLRKEITNPIFIVLDVSTDCVEDFNKVDKSMELIDLMNITVNKYDVIFLCLIHENPKSDKMRGHIGTELMNKASTVMQVGFEKDSSQSDTDIIRVKYLKCRSTAKHPPFYVKYCNDIKGLIMAESSEVSDLMNSRKHKASADDMITHIEMYLGDNSELERRTLLDNLCKDFKASQRTIEDRIVELLKNEAILVDNNGQQCYLSKFNREKKVFYRLKSIES